MDQSVLDRAVRMATKAAMDGHPVESIQWIPPLTASQNPGGLFVVKYWRPTGASTLPPWEK